MSALEIGTVGGSETFQVSRGSIQRNLELRAKETRDCECIPYIKLSITMVCRLSIKPLLENHNAY